MVNFVILLGKVNKIGQPGVHSTGQALVEMEVETWKFHEEKRISVKHVCLVFGVNMNSALRQLHEGSLVNVRGEVGYRSWVDKSGKDRHEHVITVTRLELFKPEDASGE